MYTETREIHPLRTVFFKIVLAVAILFLLMILFPTKGFVTNYVDKKMGISKDGNFNSNLIAMATAASGYYNENRLPQKTNEESKMTLKDMLDQKMIVKLTDNNGIACSSKKSYVIVKKEKEEYTMKVNLSCADKTDYIVLHMGLDGKQFPSTSTARCTFVKNLDEAWSYGEWSKWSTTKPEEGSNIQVETSSKKIKSGVKSYTKDNVETRNATKYIYDNGKVYYVCASKYDNAGVYNSQTTCKKTTKVYYEDPVYKTVTYYRYRTKTLEKGKTETKEANCDDEKIINEGYVKVTEN